MGNKQTVAGLSEDVLDDYVELSYLSKAEIIFLLKRFYSIGPELMNYNFNHRFHKVEIIEKFPVLKFNPFQDRIFSVFSSKHDDHFSFEDMLDLCSVMSENCPDTLKAAWAFKIFDIDDDKQINIDDICETIDRLTWDRSNPTKLIEDSEKHKIAKILLNEMDLQHIGSLGPMEFNHLVAKMPEFKNAFYFKL